MDPYADRCYLHAKICALYSSLYNKIDYSEIINSNNILLLLPGSESSIDPSDYIKIKEIVFRYQIRKVLGFIEINEYYTNLFKAFLSLYELRNLKLLISKAYNRKNLIELWYDIYPHNSFDRELLNGTTTPETLKEILNNTFLAEPFQLENPPDYENLESKIDIVIIKNLLAFSNELLPGQRQIFFNIAAKKVISFKMTWSSRLRFIYEWDDEAIEKYLCDIDELVDSHKELKKVVQGIEIEIEKKIRDRFQGIQKLKITDIPDIEYFLDNDFLFYAIKYFHKDFHSIYTVVLYLCLLYYQIQNLFCIIEGFHFNVQSEIIYKRIICEG